jgi:hypothetical protein
VQSAVKLRRDQRFIFYDEHGAPQQRVDASHNAAPKTPLMLMNVVRNSPDVTRAFGTLADVFCGNVQ